ncbi:hypothetical protein CQW23_25239 [Capsicum baccatum]|uniref:Uncharacterized protein n=1 Tax=Capsicum baccatum TaxID=33114 RepID=A0A2G2VKF9_CAPBA|nr:hypothetical protein CQW23_25239 [Capsicum baccatum]
MDLSKPISLPSQGRAKSVYTPPSTDPTSRITPRVFFVRRADMVELKAFLGLFGVVVNGCQIGILQLNVLKSIHWSVGAILLLFSDYITPKLKGSYEVDELKDKIGILLKPNLSDQVTSVDTDWLERHLGLHDSDCSSQPGPRFGS